MGTCVTATGYASAENIRFLAVAAATLLKQLVAVAEFALSAQDAIDNFKKLWEISNRGLAIEEAQHGHLKGTYWPAENKFMAEFVRPISWESQSVLANRYAGRMWAPIAGSFAKKLKELECNKARYCDTAYKRALQEILVARGLTKANVVTLADKIAFYEVEAVSDRSFEHRKAAVSMRQGLVGQAASLMSQAAQGYAAAANDALASANNAARAIGYNFQQMFQPDPGFHQRALSNAARSGRSSREMSTAGNMGTSEDSYQTSFSNFAPDAMGAEMTEDVGGDGYMPSTWTASSVNDVQSAVQGGDGQDLARGGKISMVGAGFYTLVDMENIDLVDVSQYMATMQQTAPPVLPGPNQSNTTYYPAGF